jgi:hypothetical protein
VFGKEVEGPAQAKLERGTRSLLSCGRLTVPLGLSLQTNDALRVQPTVWTRHEAQTPDETLSGVAFVLRFVAETHSVYAEQFGAEAYFHEKCSPGPSWTGDGGRCCSAARSCFAR